MKNVFVSSVVAAIALSVSTSVAFAQDVTGARALNDRLDDIDTAVADDLARANDAARFGNPEFRPGLSGSASLSYSGQKGNTDSQEFTLCTRLRYASGQLVQTLGASVNFTEGAGIKTEEDVFFVYDANYYLNDQFYVFALARGETDGLSGDMVNGVLNTNDKQDVFLGFGPGYRVVNTEQMTWRVQAGVGKSYIKHYDNSSESEAGVIASSRFFYAFNENVFATLDTDMLKTDSALRVNNDIGLNLKMSDRFSTRISYLTEFNDSRAIKSDNKFGVSLVYGF